MSLTTLAGSQLSQQQPVIKMQNLFDEFYTRKLYSIIDDKNLSSHERLTIAAVCRRPELRPLLLDVKFRVGETGDYPFILLSDREVMINQAILSEPIAAPFHFYHLLELLLFHSRIGKAATPVDIITMALAAFHTTLQYYEGMIELEQENLLPFLEDWIKELITQLRKGKKSGHSNLQVFHVISSALSHLIPLQGETGFGTFSDFSQNQVNEAICRASLLWPLLHPTPQILTMGGDNRLVLNKRTGLNGYGCSTRPRPWAITFSSCTASSISDLAFQEAEWLRQDLLNHSWNGKLLERCQKEYEWIRNEIEVLLELDCVPATKVILTSSGTDAELHALYFAMGRSGSPIRNIVISSSEVGSGTVAAAGGCHFDEKTPLGIAVHKGESIEGFPCERVEVSVVELRDEDGRLRTQNEIGLQTQQLVEEALASGRRVLIHLLDCSKTGISGPPLELVRQLRKINPSRVEVVVDAAQMRITRRSLHQFLQECFMIIISGSKFFTGPPFSGALIVPPPLAEQIQELAPLPEGLGAYSTPYEFPYGWQNLTTALPPVVNFGLLLRWRAALWEMKAFFYVSPENRLETISSFGSEILQRISQCSDLELFMPSPLKCGHVDIDTSWEQLPSIFTFLVYRWDGKNRRPLSFEEARFAYHCINMDITHLLPIQASDREYELMRKRCHIGQPVRLRNECGKWVGALRIAAGARLVSGVQFDEALGQTPEERLFTEIRTAGFILNKLSVIIKYWDHLNQFDLFDVIDFAPKNYQF